jgi:hypothetical protein
MKFECVIMKRFVLSFIYPLALLTAIHPIASTTARSAVVTEATTMGERPPPLLLDGVSHDRREITTGSDEARRWFNQGLELALWLQPRRSHSFLPTGSGA